jgi:23S rRNA (adenine2030-N6)-methyltransferase
MLSYQHVYHAGNAADVHKHLALVTLLRALRQKEKPFAVIDTHAGRGLYDLESEEAQKTREAESGVLRLALTADAPDPVREYLSILAAFNPRGPIRFYPGSAAIARAMLRDKDRAILLERHPREAAALRQFIAADPRFSLHVRDCYEGLPALLPPPIRRGLAVIDPSYEVKGEYEDIVLLLGRALRRWANGIYLLWYPLLPGARDRLLLREIEKLAPPKTLVSEYTFSSSAEGLQGSGLIIVNSPWQFKDELVTAMRYVVTALGFGAHSVTGQGE